MTLLSRVRRPSSMKRTSTSGTPTAEPARWTEIHLLWVRRNPLARRPGRDSARQSPQHLRLSSSHRQQPRAKCLSAVAGPPLFFSNAPWRRPSSRKAGHSAGVVPLIGDRCRIGANAVLCPSTILEPRTMIGRLHLVDQSCDMRT